ncbi:MAG: ABC transporter permease subunit, partial [Planctomycetota bacterium]
MKSDRPFYALLAAIAGGYVLLLVAMLVAEATYTEPGRLLDVLGRPAIRRSILLTVIASTAATAASLAVGVPLSYAMSRFRFRGRAAVDAVLDLPNVLPPLVLGLCLLILFQTPVLRPLASSVVYQLPAVFLAQFVVAMAAAVPVLRAAFDQTSPRTEQIAQAFGCSRWQAFWRVTLPEVRAGLVTAGAIGWAKCFGCFGPLLVFAGATRNKTEVLATTIYLELTAGDIEAAV